MDRSSRPQAARASGPRPPTGAPPQVRQYSPRDSRSVHPRVTMIDQPHPVTIVHIGAFDLASYGDQIFPLVAAHELSRRLGDVELLPFAPMGSAGGGTGGACWALGPWSAARTAEIARRASLVLCGGGEMVHGDALVYAPFYG